MYSLICHSLDSCINDNLWHQSAFSKLATAMLPGVLSRPPHGICSRRNPSLLWAWTRLKQVGFTIWSDFVGPWQMCYVIVNTGIIHWVSVSMRSRTIVCLYFGIHSFEQRITVCTCATYAQSLTNVRWLRRDIAVMCWCWQRDWAMRWSDIMMIKSAIATASLWHCSIASHNLVISSIALSSSVHDSDASSWSSYNI